MKQVFESELTFRPFHYFESHSLLFLLSDTRTQMLCFENLHHFQLSSMLVRPKILLFSQKDQNLSTFPSETEETWIKEAFLIEDRFSRYVVLAESLLFWSRELTSMPSIEELTNSEWQRVAKIKKLEY